MKRQHHGGAVWAYLILLVSQGHCATASVQLQVSICLSGFKMLGLPIHLLAHTYLLRPVGITLQVLLPLHCRHLV